MKKLAYLTLFVLSAIISASCAKATPEVVEGMLNPGGKIGSMTVKEHSPFSVTPNLAKYCGQYFIDEIEAVTSTVDCAVPSLSSLRIDIGWGTVNETTLNSNWSEMTWEMQIDDHPINLDQFEQHDVRGAGRVSRGWTIDLVDLSPGKHVIRVVWQAETPIDDGFDTYVAGRHEHILNLTVAEK
jgi:hypothetical protein